MADAPHLVGRDRPLARLGALLADARGGRRVAVLVAGEAGIGKTSLVRAAVANVAAEGATVAWGTCIDVEGAPGYWPWMQALQGLAADLGTDRLRAAAGDDGPLLATIVPAFGDARLEGASDRDRLLALDAVRRLLDRLADERPLVVVLDDLQWADRASLDLFEVVARAPAPARLALVGAYRPEEVARVELDRLMAVAAAGDHLQLEGLDADATGELVARVTGAWVDSADAEALRRRTGGHPFFLRQLALLGDAHARVDAMPMAVRDVIQRRLDRLPPATRHVLDVAAVLGGPLLPDVAGAVLLVAPAGLERDATPAVDAGILVPGDGGIRYSHDLLREAVLAAIEPERRTALHHAVTSALEARAGRGGEVAPAELARHAVAALPVGDIEPAVRWSLAAAAADAASLAFLEAAGHLHRLRAALVDFAVDVEPATMLDVVLAEADALARSGAPIEARSLLSQAHDLAERSGDAPRIAQVALARTELGARFATRRDETVHVLETALAAVAGSGSPWEARVTAALARELQHSVVEDRDRAGPLSARAVELGRAGDDPETQAACLLARHDVLWVPGQATDRVAVAEELVEVAAALLPERQAEALLLLANAQLEQGVAAFEAALERCLVLLDELGQPRHRYTALTRRTCVALLRDRRDEAEALIEEAAALGERIREPDAGNVRMSQRLELVRARAEPAELVAFADEAVSHWTGAPVHAHAVAAGFCARAGDLDRARRHVAAVEDRGGWQRDRSYLWSVYVRELAVAAAALHDTDLAAELLAALQPVAGTCGVNGAVVAFAGSHAHAAAIAAGVLGQPEAAGLLREQAATTYRRLGATGWLAEVAGAPAGADPPSREAAVASMRRRGPTWEIAFGGRRVAVPHTKGLLDIARLLAADGREVHVLDLVESADRSGAAGTVVDRAALDAYRKRLADLDADLAEAQANHDADRAALLHAERQALLDEVSRAARPDRTPRSFANHPAERARKAVTGRIRDAIRKLEPVHAELAAHLERTVVTGTYCRHRPDGTRWDVEPDA